MRQFIQVKYTNNAGRRFFGSTSGSEFGIGTGKGISIDEGFGVGVASKP